ncbi:MAG TPA: MarR family transcriptional regulator [Caulobacterales bacterium]|nr:MarR family transcriptional regulator [Caulobacterales bacterium]
MPPLDSPALLADAIASLSGKLKRKLREHATLGDLTPSQIAVLTRLEREGPATAAKLAQAEGMRPQSMSAIIQALQAEGFLESAPDPDDGRQLILSLTAACRKRIAANRAARRDWLSQAIRAKLSPAEQKQLAAGIELINRLTET